jgi:hypothetical protein
VLRLANDETPDGPAENRTGRKPLRGMTQLEKVEIVTEVRQLILGGHHDGQIKRFIADRRGLSPRSVERYLKTAREELVAATSRTRLELRSESFAWYQRVLLDPKVPVRDKILARKRMDELMGLDEPKSLGIKADEALAVKVVGGFDDSKV